VTESEFLSLLGENRDFIGNSLSSNSIDALSDFLFGHFAFQNLPEPLLIGFQTWLGVQLGFLKPSTARGGLWIGDSIIWSTMLRRTYNSESDAYDAFYSMIACYNQALKQTTHIFHLDGERKGTFLVKDFGDGLPKALEAYSIEGHNGVYARSVYVNCAPRLIGYFSNIREVESLVERTKVNMDCSI